MNETSRLKITNEDSRHTLSINLVMNFDFGVYKIVARNTNGQKMWKFRLVDEACENIPGTTMTKSEYRDIEHRETIESSSSVDKSALQIVQEGSFNVFCDSNDNLVMDSKLCHKNIIHLNLAYWIGNGGSELAVCHGGSHGFLNILNYLAREEHYNEEGLYNIMLQVWISIYKIVSCLYWLYLFKVFFHFG